MKNKIFLFWAFAFCVWAQPIFSQQFPHDDSYNLERLKQHLNSATQRSGETAFIPIRFHVVADDNGVQPVPYTYLLDLLCNINQTFAPQNMVFFMQNDNNSPFDLMKNTTLTNYQNKLTNPIIVSNNKKDAINIWFVNSIKEDDATIGSISGFYAPKEDYLLVQRTGDISSPFYTVIHELGHYFGLVHTYHGWDPYFNWFKTKSGSVVKVDKTFTNSTIPIECKNGSNCSQSGDFLCDTPPDYVIGFMANGCVEPNFKVIDPCGDTLKIVNNNYMGSFSSCANFVFSPMQYKVMETDLFSPKRANLLKNSVSTAAKIDSSTNLLTPTNNVTTKFFDPVEFDWSDVGNANYILEISKNANFTIKTAVFTTKSNATVNGLSKNSTYYWRVLAFHPLFGTCVVGKTMSKTQKFITSSSVLAEKNVLDENKIKIYPNPIGSNQSLNIELTSDESLSLSYEILSIQGQKLFQQKITLQQGENNFTIPTQNLSAGIYFFKIDHQMFRFIVE
jgi:hypothetical protein